MNLLSVALWGLIGTLIMTVMMAGAQRMGLSRMSLPFLLGTMATPQRDRALAAGTVAHLVNGWLAAVLYGAIFEALGFASWWMGGLLGLLHALVLLLIVLPALPGFHPRMASETNGPRPTRALEPPGFLGLNYGRATAVITAIAHLVYGLVLGAGYQLS